MDADFVTQFVDRSMYMALEIGQTEDEIIFLYDNFCLSQLFKSLTANPDLKPNDICLLPMACIIRNFELVELLLTLEDPNAVYDEDIDPGDGMNNLRCAVKFNHLDIVDLLLKDGRIVNIRNAMESACAFGHLEIFNRIIQDHRVDPSDNDNRAVYLATREGHLNVVNRLLEDYRVDPSVDNNAAVRLAAQGGHLAIVNRLLQDDRVDPSDYDNVAVLWAAQQGYWDIVDRLRADPRVDGKRILEFGRPSKTNPRKKNKL
jgi:ankyrin repeat protein